jgi:hypothetical protein
MPSSAGDRSSEWARFRQISHRTHDSEMSPEFRDDTLSGAAVRVHTIGRATTGGNVLARSKVVTADAERKAGVSG